MARTDRGVEVVGAVGPVRAAVDRAPVAEQDPLGEPLGLDVFEIALDAVDRSLHAPGGIGLGRTGEATGEEEGGRFGHDGHTVADLATEEIGRRGLSPAGATREDHPKRAVPVRVGLGGWCWFGHGPRRCRRLPSPCHGEGLCVTDTGSRSLRGRRRGLGRWRHRDRERRACSGCSTDGCARSCR